MKRRKLGQLACLSAVSLLAGFAGVSADEHVIPGEKYTADMKGPSAVSSFAQRQAQGGAPDVGPREVPPPRDPENPRRPGEPIMETGGATALTGNPPTVGLSFEGAWKGDSYAEPPDTMGAIGPNHFMEVINGNVSVFQKSDGQRITSESLRRFFWGSEEKEPPWDPRVVFDLHSGRWVVVASTYTEGIVLAVSLTDDPTDAFFRTSFVVGAGPDHEWADYPTLGVDENGIYIGAAVSGASAETIWAIDKAPLIAASPSLGTVTAWRNLLDISTAQPAHTYGTPGSEYIIGKSTHSALRILRVDPPLTDPTMTPAGTVSVADFNFPPAGPALGNASPINTGNDRLMMSVYRDGSLWTTHGIAVDGRAAVRWYEIEFDPVTQTPTVFQWGNVGDASLHFYFPSLMVNSAGHVALGFSGSDSNQYIGCYFTGRRASDILGDMAVPQLLKAGEAPFGPIRWGDYSYTTLDPVDEMNFWTIQEYAKTPWPFEAAWGTWVGMLGFFPCTSPADCDDANECTIDDCVDGLCENTPPANGTVCTGGLCCHGLCTTPVCSSDTDCDDEDGCTTADTCVNTDTCYAYCEYTWPACDPDPLTQDGCCGPTCTVENDWDCHCGDGNCLGMESQCNCEDDCGTPPATEVPGSTCQDGVDNDCDGYADCNDVVDCAPESGGDPACFCYDSDNSGPNPLVCVYWDGPVAPDPPTDFVFDFGFEPQSPDVTLFTGDDGWVVWSQASRAENIPANLGHIKVNPTLTTDNFSVTLAHGASAGAANVSSMSLVDVAWTGQSNLSGGSIAGDLTGDLVLQESGGQGGVASFTIGGDLYGDVYLPKVDTLDVKGAVVLGAMITIDEMVGAKNAAFNTNTGDFAGTLSFPNGLGSGAVVSINGRLTDAESVDFNVDFNEEQDLAGLFALMGGSSEQSAINVGRLTGTVFLFNDAYLGSATFASV